MHRTDKKASFVTWLMTQDAHLLTRLYNYQQEGLGELMPEVSKYSSGFVMWCNSDYLDKAINLKNWGFSTDFVYGYIAACVNEHMLISFDI